MLSMNILLSRTDSIGDVILTIPMAGYIKQKLPEAKVFFLGKTYTKAIVESSEYIDEFINWDELSKLSKTEQTEQTISLRVALCLSLALAVWSLSVPLREEKAEGS